MGVQEKKKRMDELEKSLAAVEEELSLKRTEVRTRERGGRGGGGGGKGTKKEEEKGERREEKEGEKGERREGEKGERRESLALFLIAALHLNDGAEETI